MLLNLENFLEGSIGYYIPFSKTPSHGQPALNCHMTSRGSIYLHGLGMEPTLSKQGDAQIYQEKKLKGKKVYCSFSQFTHKDIG
jgi:hypothetical protein